MSGSGNIPRNHHSTSPLSNVGGGGEVPKGDRAPIKVIFKDGASISGVNATTTVPGKSSQDASGSAAMTTNTVDTLREDVLAGSKVPSGGGIDSVSVNSLATYTSRTTPQPLNADQAQSQSAATPLNDNTSETNSESDEAPKDPSQRSFQEKLHFFKTTAETRGTKRTQASALTQEAKETIDKANATKANATEANTTEANATEANATAEGNTSTSEDTHRLIVDSSLGNVANKIKLFEEQPSGSPSSNDTPSSPGATEAKNIVTKEGFKFEGARHEDDRVAAIGRKRSSDK